MPDSDSNNKTLSVGIDLGTSRSVISTSSGARQWVESYVGWPKDFVAQKLLGKKILFGADALEHRLSLDLVRPLARGVIKEGTDTDEESVKELIGHLIELANPDKDASIHAAVGIPAEALKVNRAAIKQAVSNFADKLIVVSEPFAVAYGVNALDDAMIVDIGAGTVDFCIMHGTIPDEEDQRSLLTAGDYIDEQLFELMTERYPEANITINMVRNIKEKHGFVGEPRKKVQVDLPVRGVQTAFDVTTELKRACESIMPAIVETTMDMIAKFDPEFQERARKNIVLAGGCSQISGIENYLINATKEFASCKFSRVEDPLYAGADGALGLSEDMPAKYWENI